MRFSFRNRIFAGIVLLGALPLAVAVIALTLQTRTSSSLAGPRIALDEIAESSRQLSSTFDTLVLDTAQREALRQHADIISRGTRRIRQAEALSRFSAGALATVVLISGVGIVGGSIYLAQRWSRTVSQPVENLIGLMRRIERREPLPTTPGRQGSPEIEALTRALYDLSAELEQARMRELEQERLVAFREVARRVAHEIRGPVTASRLAVAQLERASNPPKDVLAVLHEETDRLERMAAEFSEFGRLPEGPRAEIDIAELIESVVTASVPTSVSIRMTLADQLIVNGHYEPLRRAVNNLVANAIDATDERGIGVTATREPDTNFVLIDIRDHGPGVQEDQRTRVFEPYVTTKPKGTGLGLAIVRQIVEAHGGSVTVRDAPSGGASFVVRLPESVS